MCKKQYLTRFRSSLAIATIAVGLVAGQSLPAAAHVGVAMQPDRGGREQVQMQMHRNAPVQPARTYASSAPPDYCDLPSAGCESYLSN